MELQSRCGSRCHSEGLGGGGGGSAVCDLPEFFATKLVAARKRYRCIECDKHTIQPGTVYEQARGKWDGEVRTLRTCPRCLKLREQAEARGYFRDHECGFEFGTLWEVIRDTALDTVQRVRYRMTGSHWKTSSAQGRWEAQEKIREKS